MDLAALRNQIASRLQSVAGLRIYGYIPDNPIVPCAVVYPEPFLYHDTMDGGENPKIVVQFLAGTVATEAAQADMDGWISTGTDTSCVDAIESQVDGAASMEVEQMRSYGTIQLQDQGVRYYSAEIVVDIVA